MHIITLDFETYYDDAYTLKQMSTEAYIRDPRFDFLGCGVRWNDAQGKVFTKFLQANEVHKLKALHWDQIGVIAHHAHFDGLILSHHLGIKPKFWFDTLSMARMMLGNHLPKSLDALAKHYGLQAKNMPYDMFRGKHWHELHDYAKQLVATGCQTDCMITFEVFDKLLDEGFPREELALVDLTVRMFTEPMLVGDRPLFQDIVREEAEKKDDLLAAVGVTATELGSNERFSQLLNEAGIEVQYKAGSNGLIPQFAKTDPFMRDYLLEHADDYVVALANARIGIKSTTVGTRAAKFDDIASRGPVPIYLNYCGAHTTRWSGGDDSNPQNLKRRHRIRKGLRAPPGYKFAAPDASQIECRLLNYTAGQWDIVDAFRRGKDIYCMTASAVYKREITKADEAERGTGKQCELSCGFGSGWRTFKRTAALGTYGPPQKLTNEEAQHAVNTYRKTHDAVVKLWAFADAMVIPALANRMEMQWGPTWIKDGCIWLPNGAPLIYDTLEWTADPWGGWGWAMRTRRGYTNMYGGKLVENWIQALARTHSGQCMKEIARAGLRVVGMSHDDTWVLIPDGPRVQEAVDYCVSVIATPPKWLPEVPLAAEGKWGDSYA